MEYRILHFRSCRFLLCRLFLVSIFSVFSNIMASDSGIFFSHSGIEFFTSAHAVACRFSLLTSVDVNFINVYVIFFSQFFQTLFFVTLFQYFHFFSRFFQTPTSVFLTFTIMKHHYSSLSGFNYSQSVCIMQQ